MQITKCLHFVPWMSRSDIQALKQIRQAADTLSCHLLLDHQMEAYHCIQYNVVDRLLKCEHLTCLCHEDAVSHTTTTSSSIDARDAVRTILTPSFQLKLVYSFPASTLYLSAPDDSLLERQHEDGNTLLELFMTLVRVAVTDHGRHLTRDFGTCLVSCEATH